ncbi:hypothetical protein BDW59DRAFT_156817 [Aspergillus cavernicola]|uniref:Uncharacterized protein n=1 Tax=Aspergillus cavernicola TaxID=176166 RepID=A0ABR4IZY5_9EURO
MHPLISFAAMLGLITISLALPPVRDTQKVNIVIQQIKDPFTTDLAIMSTETTDLLGYSCSHSLEAGAFAGLPITANVTENGVDTLSVGSQVYPIHEDPKVSGGIAYTRVYTPRGGLRDMHHTSARFSSIDAYRSRKEGNLL